MGRYYVYTPNSVKKVIKKFPWDRQMDIRAKLLELETNPRLGVPMQGKYSDRRKIVVGNYRIIYYINEIENIIEIKEVESRGNMSYDR